MDRNRVGNAHIWILTKFRGLNTHLKNLGNQLTVHS